ncbi:MAG TPA: hypothetical protein VGA13_04360 [Acidimicrobiales bacterium]
MSRWSNLRRFVPLMAVVGIQLVIVAAVPSRQPTQAAATAGSPGDGLEFDGTGSGSPFGGLEPGEIDDTETVAGSTTDGSDGGSGGAGPSATGSDPSTPGTPTNPDAPPTRAAGDTSHCVGGRQADPAIYAHVPPCAPGFGTADNGGATAPRGVTEDTIKVVVYRGNLGEAVDAILTAQGSNPTNPQFDSFMDAAFGWISDNYEMYGRRIEVVRISGQCPSVPPDYSCLRNEVRQIVRDHEPFAFIWNTSLASPFFDELSALKVVNLGGWGFRDQFSLLRRPYHYDVTMGGTQLVDSVAEWYCKRMYGGGTAKARYAGDPAIADRVRVLGVISTDDPENKNAIDELRGFLADKCGATIAHTYFYAQDITTAEQQRDAVVREMRKDPESTSVMCFCDLVAPLFLYGEAQDNGYFPEHVMVATGFMDADASAQAYGTLETREDSRGSQFDNAFGLAQLYDESAEGADHSTRVWNAAGNEGPAPYASAYRDFEYYAMLGSLIQGAGPGLTPENMEIGAARGALDSAPGGFDDPKLNVRSVRPEKTVAGGNRDYTWWDSLREIYWSTENTSERNGEVGTYMPVGSGRWFVPGQFPSGLIELPAKPR